MAPTPRKMSSTPDIFTPDKVKIEGLSICPGANVDENCALPFTAYAHPLILDKESKMGELGSGGTTDSR